MADSSGGLNMNIGVIFAGGSGKRMHTKGTPKQFLEVDGKPIIIHTLDKFELCQDVDAIVVVCLESYIPHLKKLISRYALKKVLRIVPGGKSGQESIYHGLCATEELVGGKETIVLIHDGVRPLITEELLSANIEKAKSEGNAITVAPATETIFQFEQDTRIVSKIYDRSTCFVAKAPQTFWLKDILKAHEKAQREHMEYIDSASLMQAAGYTLHTVESTPDNIKVTTPSDYYMLKAIMTEKTHSEIFGL